MACDKCDPKKVHRQQGVEKIAIPVVDVQATGSKRDVDIHSCKHCGQEYVVLVTI
ncbi:MAG: hypothetical protein IIC67_10670 [Thaumarchaeota archaeon]|nr:hypothetical protein [Nitrososphaerota archaeon]